MKLIMCKGLPASGKSTWAKTQNAIRISKDDLRTELHNGVWSRENEKEVIKERDKRIIEGLKTSDVVSDDTNLAPKHQERLKQLARECGAEFEIKYFTDVSLDECLKRDKNRENSVGEKVIIGMYDQFLRPVVQAPTIYSGLPTCIICDIDGTLAIKGNRSPFEWHRVGEDSLNLAVADILDSYKHKDVEIIIFSGRDSICREETETWLAENNINYHDLFMRAKNDNRKDSIIKRELYDREIKDKFNVLFVLDDRNQVVDMWRKDLGLTCLQVNYGDF